MKELNLLKFYIREKKGKASIIVTMIRMSITKEKDTRSIELVDDKQRVKFGMN